MPEFAVSRPDKPFESWISEEVKQKQNLQRVSPHPQQQIHHLPPHGQESALKTLDRPDKKPI